ncbi:family 16 glycoside hydrolase [Rhodopirellula sallentina]|uniref:Protein containing DUF1080 n=1 Tax=Rhodopirellula sallentina SM41 TaxID=1263870 RepID=M5U5C5_9BACT|nr:family 16 glycoside hydrolase [Rhodopirellula sallentina]EMI53061.1 protein containing DUF1080 [Rhodopirellula sallentina SM41]
MDAASNSGEVRLHLFNGSDFSGWNGDFSYWKVEDGAIVGRLPPSNSLSKRTYLTSDHSFVGDFELEFDCAIEEGNSGVVYRTSRPRSDPLHAFGLQIDIDGANSEFGAAYEERGLASVAEVGESVTLSSSGAVSRSPITPQITDDTSDVGSDWKHYRVVAVGDSIEHYVNGRLTSRISDPHRRLSQQGLVALQLHKGKPMTVRFKDITFYKGRRFARNTSDSQAPQTAQSVPSNSNDPGVLILPAATRSNGKHIVLLAGDQEYRSEETMPMLGKILSQRHGFRCTVLFPLSANGSYIDPTNKQGLKGLNTLSDADLMIIGTRFLEPIEKEAKHLTDFLNAGKPVIGIRTATHAFGGNGSFGGNLPYVEFGRRILGEEWAGHHGKYKSQGSRGVVEAGKQMHPILSSVSRVFAKTNVYQAPHLTKEDEVLMRGAVTETQESASRIVSGGINQPMQPIAWLHPYKSPGGANGQSFCLTAGASVDFANEDLRRLIVNAVYFLTGGKVPIKSDVEFVDPFDPSSFGHFREKDHWQVANLHSDDFGLLKRASVSGNVTQAAASSILTAQIQPSSVWRSSDAVLELLILDRNGEDFRARMKVGKRIIREVRGTVKNDRISWLAKDVHPVGENRQGGDNLGTIRHAPNGVVIDFMWKGPNGSGEFALRSAGAFKPPSGVFQVGTHFFKVFDKQLTWDEARDECTRLGGTLAKVDAMDIHEHVFREAKKIGMDSVWIGACDAEVEGSWKWIDGTPLSFSRWGPGQPNNKQESEHFALLIVEFRNPKYVGTWADQPSSSTEHRPGFVCQWTTNGSIGETPTTSSTTTAAQNPRTVKSEMSTDSARKIRLFNGRNLIGWRGLPRFWSVKRGGIVGSTFPNGIPEPTFLVSEKEYQDFELNWKVKLVGAANVDSGLNFRSGVADASTFKMWGPQCNLGFGSTFKHPWGTVFYKGHKSVPKQKWHFDKHESDVNLVNSNVIQNGFNEMQLRCVGKDVVVKLNGVIVLDRDIPKMPESGRLGWQLWSGSGPMEIHLKDIEIIEL